ncbi:4-hydroxy-tetrahydrodipicolinate reductase [Nocardioides guangzhouensis]|uniref:4-hydroxy-tetrahydrodipicolinate reductase n=1 Tax=Nocardioides guangzhouensis TaxID=2497878 RepID=A0A4Q4ZFZ5_9ACTN|nr:4-hydroxy-tetrahydrodipicolinate reductase [Nocardioides guangzhouensis]RYP86224.1 4-hydroxy-tetrahydrodipicolinate reductase [Nocardioides guangzhouensis]
MTTVCFAGITGWTAPPIAAAIAASDDLELVAGVSRSAAGRDLRDVTGLDVDGWVHGSVVEAVASGGVDVLVDYTSAEAVGANARAAVDAGVHVVIGSSGLTADDYARLDAAARDRNVGVVAAGNFSVMAALLQRAAVLAAQHLEHWEILDYGSDTKPDVPSGTARQLAEALGEVRTPRPAVPVEDLSGPVEARGAEVGGTRVHSVRLPGYVVSTEVVFAAAGEHLVLRHDPGPTPTPYVDGTLLAIRRVPGIVGVVRGLDRLLFGD